MKRKVFGLFLVLTAFVCSGYLLRDTLCSFAAKSLIKHKIPLETSYRSISSRDGRVLIEGLQCASGEYKFYIDEASYTINFKKVLLHPKEWIAFIKKSSPTWIDALATIKDYGEHLHIENGILTLNEERYFFTFRKGMHCHEIGKLLIAQDPGLLDHPFLSVQLNMTGKQLITQVRVDQIPSHRFLNLAAFAFDERLAGFSRVDGEIELSASFIFNEYGLIEALSTQFGVENFEVIYPQAELAIRMQHLKGDLNYPRGAEDTRLPMWKRMLCDVELAKGTFIYGDKLALDDLTGFLALNPRTDPSLSLKGELIGQDTPLALSLEGKGAIHDDHAYWLEFGLNLDDRAGTDCGAFLSICRPETDSHVVQVEASHLLPKQAEMLKAYFGRSIPRLKEWEITQGSFGGKLVALFEKGMLSHFEIQDFIGENVQLLNGNDKVAFSRIEGEGRLFEEFRFDLDLSIAQFFGLFSKTYEETFNTFQEDAPAHLSTAVRFNAGSVETLGSVEFLPFHESLQFGFKSDSPLPKTFKEVSEGWARSERLSEHLYAPFVTSFSEDLEMKGDVDLVATYNGYQIDLAMQISQFHAKHPALELKSESIGLKERTEGRARVFINPETGTYKGFIPVKDAQGYDCTYGIIARNLNGTFHFRDGDVWGEVAHSDLSYDGRELIKAGGFKLSLNPHFLIQDFTGGLVLPTDKDFILSVPHLDASTLSCAVFDGKEKVLQFEGKKETSWEGALKAFGINEKMMVKGDWNYLEDHVDLAIQGQTFKVEAVKQGSELLVKELQLPHATWRALVTTSPDGYVLQHVEMKSENIELQGEGTLMCILPAKERSFGLMSDLLIQGQIKSPMLLSIASKKPARVAYSPTLGLVVSDLELETDGGEFYLQHMEQFPQKGIKALRSCHFHASEELISKCVEANVLPAFIQEFRFSKELKGVAHAQFEKDKAHVEAVIDKGAGWNNHDLLVVADIDKKDCRLHLREEGSEGLTIGLKMGDQLEVQQVSGSLGRLCANLKKKGNALKGNLNLDFTLFDELFDLPINQYVSNWQAGGGYAFEGIFKPSRELKDWGFKGKLKGDGFECKGYRLRSLEARLEVAPGQISIANLDLSDDAGKLWISEGSLMRSGSNWTFYFPLIELRGFQPSFLQKMRGKEQPISPLIIKKGTIEELRGRIDDPRTITGQGSFQFTNISKTGESAYPKNLPVRVIEGMGLDGSMFVPTSGEVDFVMQQGRCYFRQLKNVASDQRRSEFLPPKNGVIGYLDFNGSIFLDVQMRQRVVRSISSNISYRVRGSIEDPEILLR